jgi:hypothetical protein
METSAQPEGRRALAEFAAQLAKTMHEGYPADGVQKFRVTKKELTSHYANAVRSAASRVHLKAVFEQAKLTRNSRERFDAILRDSSGQLAGVVEWEYQPLLSVDRITRRPRLHLKVNELRKLKEICRHDVCAPWFACYIGYVQVEEVQRALELVGVDWSGTATPLLLVLIHFVRQRIPNYKEKPVRVFKQMTMHEIQGDGSTRILREPPALPWDDDIPRHTRGTTGAT